MSDVRPFPKSAQLGRSPKRHRASKQEWDRIAALKAGPCRVCSRRGPFLELHHLVRRGHGGDDVPDNLVPVCRADHEALHSRRPTIGRLLLTRLSDAEYAYMIERGGEDYPERVYGVEYVR